MKKRGIKKNFYEKVVDNMIDVKGLSNVYYVRNMHKEDVPMIYEMTKKNTLYYKYCGRENTIDDIYNDFENVPQGKEISDLYYLGYFQDEDLVCVLVLLDKYPDEETIYIGFFMMNNEYQGKGIGSSIITEVCDHFKLCGYTKVQLGIDKDNPQSRHFWKKNGFEEIREVKHDEGIVIAAEKQL